MPFQQALQATIDSNCNPGMSNIVDFATMLAKEVKTKGEPTLKKGSIQKFLSNSRANIGKPPMRSYMKIIVILILWRASRATSIQRIK